MEVPPSNKKRVSDAPVRKVLFLPDSTEYLDGLRVSKIAGGIGG
jgi:hypothetical protein